MSVIYAIDVTEALFQDLPELSSMEFGSINTSWSLDALSQSLSNGCQILKILVDGQSCGYCLFRNVRDETEILNIVIAESRRRQGLAKTLLIGLIEKLRSPSSGKIWLEVRKSNTAAQKMYEIMGFKQAGIRKNYYRVGKTGSGNSGREDALVLCKDL
jgi:ribosomal-protein-alanine N-acetyltransferase